ncbi:hypothetical protein ABE096_06420 [Robertmurraya massiliosenegalensis]|uniref:hypothetical protein n=1 Tax=Robertmurraya TaxID=2837507 RepID=UPI0039A54B52
MKAKSIKIFSVLFICLLIFSTHAFAARTTITLPSGQTWVSKYDTRSGNYSTVNSRLYAVYPTNGGTDNFTRINVKVTSFSGSVQM